MTFDIDSITLRAGSHTSHEEGVCLLEAVAWMAGEPHSDHPACVSPVLAAFGRGWNDSMRSVAERKQLKQYIPLLLDTVAEPEVEELRSQMAMDWLVRVNIPAWLRLAGLEEHAERLERLQPNSSIGDIVRLAQPILTDAEGVMTASIVKGGLDADCWYPAWRAVEASAGAAALTTVWTTRWYAEYCATIQGAMWHADSSSSVKYIPIHEDRINDFFEAARVVAATATILVLYGSQDVSVLEPTVLVMQKSAHKMYRRMIACGQ